MELHTFLKASENAEKGDRSDGYDNTHSNRSRGFSSSRARGRDIPQKARESLIAPMNLIDTTRATVVGTRIITADTSLTRLIGLLGKRRLDAGCGLLIKPSSGIHTFGMLFSIDVVALSKSLQVIKLWHRLPPLRVTSINWKIHSILELPAGQIRNCRLEVGDQLEFL